MSDGVSLRRAAPVKTVYLQVPVLADIYHKNKENITISFFSVFILCKGYVSIFKELILCILAKTAYYAKYTAF